MVLLFSSCSFEKEDRLKISINSWIGYSPIFFAYEKGWLDKYDIKVINTVSLAESFYIFNAKNADAFVGTQYEHTLAKEFNEDLYPVMMFDKSDGGDMVMSNRTIKELQSSSKLDVYLEIDSVNSIVLEDFLSYYDISVDKINYINSDQENISLLQNNSTTKPTVIVTYSPYNFILAKNNFSEVSSTKDNLAITVVDALYTTQVTFAKHQNQFEGLKKETDKAILFLQTNPKEYYEAVKYYLQDVSYEEFQEMLQDVQWINKELSLDIKTTLEKESFPINGLL